MLSWLRHILGGKTRRKQHEQVSRTSNENTGISQTHHTAHAPHTMPCGRNRRQRSWEESLPKRKFQLSSLPWSLALRWRKQQNLLFFLSSFSKSATVTPSVEHRQFHYASVEGSNSNARGLRKLKAAPSAGSDRQTLNLPSSHGEIYSPGPDRQWTCAFCG